MSDHIVTDVGEEILATYNLMLLGPLEPWPGAALGILAGGVKEAQENLTDLMPRGFRVVIREWSSDE